MPLIIFVFSILFLRGYDVGTALAIVGILNFSFAIFRNILKELEKSKEEIDFERYLKERKK